MMMMRSILGSAFRSIIASEGGEVVSRVASNALERAKDTAYPYLYQAVSSDAYLGFRKAVHETVWFAKSEFGELSYNTTSVGKQFDKIENTWNAVSTLPHLNTTTGLDIAEELFVPGAAQLIPPALFNYKFAKEIGLRKYVECVQANTPILNKMPTVTEMANYWRQ